MDIVSLLATIFCMIRTRTTKIIFVYLTVLAMSYWSGNYLSEKVLSMFALIVVIMTLKIDHLTKALFMHYIC